MTSQFTERESGFHWLEGEWGWPSKFSSHSYFLKGETRSVLIDPGCSTHRVGLETFFPKEQSPDMIVVTHEHWDHVCAVDFFPKAEKACSRNGLRALNRKDDDVIHHEQRGEKLVSKFTRGLEDGDVIELGKFKLEILLTPGHTAGSLCVYEPERKWLFTGDSLFSPPMLSGIFESGSRAEHIHSLERLFLLAKKRGVDMIYPGHGAFIEGRPDCLDAIAETLERAKEDIRS
jgi:hydroxyacylglutathione hydrolase